MPATTRTSTRPTRSATSSSTCRPPPPRRFGARTPAPCTASSPAACPPPIAPPPLPHPLSSKTHPPGPRGDESDGRHPARARSPHPPRTAGLDRLRLPQRARLNQGSVSVPVAALARPHRHL